MFVQRHRTESAGPDLRSAVSGAKVTIFGATGFIGRYVTQMLGTTAVLWIRACVCVYVATDNRRLALVQAPWEPRALFRSAETIWRLATSVSWGITGRLFQWHTPRAIQTALFVPSRALIL